MRRVENGEAFSTRYVQTTSLPASERSTVGWASAHHPHNRTAPVG